MWDWFDHRGFDRGLLYFLILATVISVAFVLLMVLL